MLKKMIIDKLDLTKAELTDIADKTFRSLSDAVIDVEVTGDGAIISFDEKETGDVITVTLSGSDTLDVQVVSDYEDTEIYQAQAKATAASLEAQLAKAKKAIRKYVRESA